MTEPYLYTKATIIMPQLFYCREHRAVPERGMGPAYCWRCELRQTLWASLWSDSISFSRAASQRCFPAGKVIQVDVGARGQSPGALVNVKPGWRSYITDPNKTEEEFSQDFPDDYAHGNWSVIEHWRANVAWH